MVVLVVVVLVVVVLAMVVVEVVVVVDAFEFDVCVVVVDVFFVVERHIVVFQDSQSGTRLNPVSIPFAYLAKFSS